MRKKIAPIPVFLARHRLSIGKSGLERDWGGNEGVGVEIWEGDSGMLWEEPTGFSSIVSRSNSHS